MKLQDIQEARYASPNYATWIEERIKTLKDPFVQKTINDYDLAYNQFTKKFGPPKFTQEDKDYDVWIIQRDNELTLHRVRPNRGITPGTEGVIVLQTQR